MQSVAPDDLRSMVESTWEAMLGLPLAEIEAPYETSGAGPFFSACVTIAGEWNGAVVLDMPVSLAQQVAGAMFAMEVDELADDEILDALGEVANMIGGNVKGVLSGDNKLSLPTVAEGPRDFKIVVPGAAPEITLVFDSDDTQLQVSLLVRKEG